MDITESNQTTPKPVGELVRECCLCFAELKLLPGDRRRSGLDPKCDDCTAAELEKREKLERDRRQRKADAALKAVPVLFNTTKRELLPEPANLDEALEWQFGPCGLLLFGPSGCGKSRIAWEVAKREIKAGRQFKNLSFVSLMRYPAMLFGSGSQGAEFMDALIAAELLLMDDVFKAKATERVEELVFAVIDERANAQRPCIITLNDTSESLEARLSVDRGPALVRRLREFCRVIQFQKPDTRDDEPF